MPSGRLLIVAPDTEVRHSLVFLLEAEGYSVVVRDRPPALAWLTKHRFDCTILDQKAVAGEAYENIAFCIKAHPVVLLATRPHVWLTEWVARTVDLPLAANDMATAVRSAMQLEA